MQDPEHPLHQTAKYPLSACLEELKVDRPPKEQKLLDRLLKIVKRYEERERK